MFAVSDSFEEMSRSTSSPVFLVCLTLCVWLSSLTAQSTTDQCQSDEGNARQVVLMEQMISMNDRQMALMEQMHSTLRPIDRRMEESNEGLKCFRGNDGKRSCYKFVQVKMTREKATTYCRNIGEGVDLVSIESQEETNFLASVITGLPAKCGLYHTSGKKTSGEWQWAATGQPFNYTSWAPPEPNGNGNFCFIWNSPPGWKTWDDRPDTEACFICEYRR
ncbi:Lithostathine-1 [Lamellibrachia satsuma]|nr:Lithostathine-1 [Lamellibrachia satsuma]